MKPFHFLADGRAAMPGKELAEKARRAESMGFHALVVPDHLIDQMSPVPAMTAIAAATETCASPRSSSTTTSATRIGKGRVVDARSLTFEATVEKIAWVRDAAGDRFDRLEFNAYPSGWPITVTDDLRGEARRVIDSLKERTGVELTEAEVLDAPHIFIGSVDRLIEKFEGLRERLGISSFMVGQIDELAPVVERLAGK